MAEIVKSLFRNDNTWTQAIAWVKVNGQWIRSFTSVKVGDLWEPGEIPLELFTPIGSESELSSTLFTASVSNNIEYREAFVFSRQRPVIAAYGLQFTGGTPETNPYRTKLWLSGSEPEVSFFTFGSPSPTTVKISRTDIDISSAILRPRSYGYSSTIINGDLYISMEPMDKVWVEVNNDTSSPLFIFCDPPKPEIPTSGCMYFSPGKHYLSSISGPHQTVTLSGTDPSGNTVTEVFHGMGFSSFASSGYVSGQPFTIYLDGGAYVIGSMNVKDIKDLRITGRGILSLENIPKERYGNPYLAKFNPYSYTMERDDGGIAIHGNDNYDEIVGDGSFNRQPSGVTIDGITILDTPFYTIRGMNGVDNVKLISPWSPNADGANVIGDKSTNFAYIRDSFMFLADDCMYAAHNARGPIGGTSAVFSGNIMYSQSNGPIALSYWPRFYFSAEPPFFPDATHDCIIHDNVVGAYSMNRPSVETIIRATVDGDTTTSNVLNYGLYDITLSNITIEEPIDGAPMWIGNISDPFNNYGSGYGGISGLTFANIAFSSSTFNDGSISSLRIEGKDSIHRPYALRFINISINGEFITDANRDNFVNFNSFTDPDIIGDNNITFTVT